MLKDFQRKGSSAADGAAPERVYRKRENRSFNDNPRRREERRNEGFRRSEDRDFDPYWGIVCESVYIDEERQTSSHYSRFLGSYAPSLENQASQETQPGAFSADFLHLKKHYKVSWQDLLKISRFNLTVDVSYA